MLIFCIISPWLWQMHKHTMLKYILFFVFIFLLFLLLFFILCVQFAVFNPARGYFVLSKLLYWSICSVFEPVNKLKDVKDKRGIRAELHSHWRLRHNCANWSWSGSHILQHTAFGCDGCCSLYSIYKTACLRFIVISVLFSNRGWKLFRLWIVTLDLLSVRSTYLLG